MGEKVFLRVHAQKSTIHYGKVWKLAPCFVGLFKILERIGLVAYHLDLLPNLAYFDDVFHVLDLRSISLMWYMFLIGMHCR